MQKFGFALFALSFTLSACGPSKDHLNHYQKTRTYPVSGECVESVAAVVIERNGRFDVAASMGSAFLRNKERGIFATARHVIKLDVEYKLFFCGKVYKALRILDPGVTDVGFLKITDKFDPDEFPEPYPIGGTVATGEKVFVQGVHMHPDNLQKGHVVHKIVEDYYQLSKYGREFVYDNLEAEIIDLSLRLQYSEEENRAEEREYLIRNNLTPLRTKEDHKISFGGLSGGPTLNQRGEVVGINVTQHDEGYFVWDERGLNYRPRVTLEILPAEELKRAMARLNITAR